MIAASSSARCVEQLAEAEQDACALGERRGAPRRERGLRGGDRVVDVVGRGERDLRGDAAGGRVEHVADARRRLPPPSVRRSSGPRGAVRRRSRRECATWSCTENNSQSATAPSACAGRLRLRPWAAEVGHGSSEPTRSLRARDIGRARGRGDGRLQALPRLALARGVRLVARRRGHAVGRRSRHLELGQRRPPRPDGRRWREWRDHLPEHAAAVLRHPRPPERRAARPRHLRTQVGRPAGAQPMARRLLSARRPVRRRGIVQLLPNDVDAAVAELRWAADTGASAA